MRTHILLACCISLYSVAYGQKPEYNHGFRNGYLVFLNGDTLSGEIKIRDERDQLLGRIHYRADEGANVKNYSLKLVKVFQLGPSFYRVVNEKLYKQIAIGRISVYEHREREQLSGMVPGPFGGAHYAPIGTGVEHANLVLIREDGLELEFVPDGKLIPAKLKRRLQDFFGDNEHLSTKIQEGYYSTDDIVYMAYEFNDPAKYQLKLITQEDYIREEKKRKREKRSLYY